jgi:hypothetical protein
MPGTNSGEGWDVLSPLGRAALLLSHDIRRYAVEHVRQHGEVTSRDVVREYPAANAKRVGHLLRLLADDGVLVQLSGSGRVGAARYRLGSLADLRALHAYLTDLLKEAPNG